MTRRSAGAAILYALPVIGLLTVIIWTIMGASTAVLALFLDLDLIGLAIGVVLFTPPAAWANWHIVRLAIDAERQFG